MSESFSLAIANLGIAVRCTPSTSAAIIDLQERYQDFPLDGNVRLSLEVILSGNERSSALLDTGMYFQDGMLHFDAPGYKGTIVVEEGSGQLMLSSSNPAGDIDYFIRSAYALLAYQAGGLMLHAAGIVRKGLAYLFFGHSGAGKTTVCRLTSEGTVLNDDLVILLPEGEGWRVFGTPFWNPTQAEPTQDSAPLKALFWLVQAEQVRIESMDNGNAIAELAGNVPVIPADPGRTAALLVRLDRISQTAAVQKLHFRKDDSFWDVIRSYGVKEF